MPVIKGTLTSIDVLRSDFSGQTAEIPSARRGAHLGHGLGSGRIRVESQKLGKSTNHVVDGHRGSSPVGGPVLLERNARVKITGSEVTS